MEYINLNLFSYAAQNRKAIAWETAKRELELFYANLPALCDLCEGTGVFEGYEPEYNKVCPCTRNTKPTEQELC